MYSGIDSSSIPRNSVTRFCAETNTAIPSTLNSSSAWYSPWPDFARRDRAPATSAPRDRRRPRTACRARAPGRRSRSAPEMIDVVVVEAPDREPRSRAEREQRQRRHDLLADHGRAQQADQQHDAAAAGQRDERRERLPVDVRALDVRPRRASSVIGSPPSTCGPRLAWSCAGAIAALHRRLASARARTAGRTPARGSRARAARSRAPSPSANLARGDLRPDPVVERGDEQPQRVDGGADHAERTRSPRSRASPGRRRAGS